MGKNILQRFRTHLRARKNYVYREVWVGPGRTKKVAQKHGPLEKRYYDEWTQRGGRWN